uniref:Uncharacterized protein n=1 Tax=Siphoviridae sp. ctHl62 TaxID=2826235 RepID=A0A8S5MHF6_9CAUD|nr:MAG TPA: hypothetical protein [Siphoviridae sp. ctHl62]DAO14951.1 MAG TPA: hypothetical protein [Caudoviricetes sp.]DAP11800.1 MAG TPA: hypothetical protein [Caudoviricetes sp.]DAT02942.1 MAG TPA: hypothetical protein [Caudoviricetes sp.]DAY21544.1 MAG TPA: hypothetical protein [Caudoviricetes sp.]
MRDNFKNNIKCPSKVKAVVLISSSINTAKEIR